MCGWAARHYWLVGVIAARTIFFQEKGSRSGTAVLCVQNTQGGASRDYLSHFPPILRNSLTIFPGVPETAEF